MVNAKRLLVRLAGVLPLLLASCLISQAQTTTTVSDKLYGPDGSAASGTLTVTSHDSFTAQDGTNVVSGQKSTATIASDGSFSVNLVPNIGSSPINTYYDVEYMTATSRVTEEWAVPISGTTVNLKGVRIIWPTSKQIYTFGTISMNIETPAISDTGRITYELPTNATITRVGCYVTGGGSSANVNLSVRSESTPDSGGSQVLTSDLACAASFSSSTTFTNSGVNVRSPIAVTFSSVSGTPQWLHIFVEYRVKLT